MIRDYIKRQRYIDRIGPFIDGDVIKVITGQRRVGKSYLLFQIMDEIRRRRPDADILYINKELHEFDHIRTHSDLTAFISDRPASEGRTCLFIDEIQEIEGFERAVRSLAAGGGYDIYCTGSNAAMMSGELATLLSGRYVEIRVYSLTYPEFLLFHNLPDAPDAFLKYLRYGGLPYLRHLNLEDDIVFDYLINIYHTILLKDIVARHGIRNVDFLERLTEFLADNIGNIFSAKRISDFLKSQKISTSPNSVLTYLSYLTAAFFIFKVRRSDIEGKKIFEIGEKYYFEDIGLRNAIVGFSQKHIGRLLENIVFMHLNAAGYRVTVGQAGDKEVDFVCDRGGERLYVQVAYLLPDEKTHEREFGNLLAVADNHPKVVLSMDDMITDDNYKGVHHINLRRFLARHPDYFR
jgi:predicted AAA+ superfamily ATPase